MMRSLLFMVLLAGAVAAALPDARTQREIAHLIQHLGSSGCQFNRNGSWYSAARAVAHLKRKYDYMLERNLVTNAESFIEQAATTSSASGKPYLVRCKGKSDVPSGTWFQEALKSYRANG